MFKQQVSSDLCATLNSILSLKSTDNILYRLVEKSLDIRGRVFKQQVSSNFCATLNSILSLKSTDNILYRLVEKSLDIRGSVFKQQVSSNFCATLNSILSLKITDNVLYRVVQKSLDMLNIQDFCHTRICSKVCMYRGVDKSLARPTSRCILFDG